ncbi:hypothetical protein MKS88_003501 [Plasmodium brasilianum]|uniref:Uncharacterized protein n=2 Tax=Plasmodium (Plasmodium) TaxID=418103 RepID=A0A1A8WYX5_PLAMA|nr:Plasmodium exported protein, unknown function [Plasmodium malariae]KAI4837034.1 hypothetical protein MKS88_003501 [Plasmodium brasilianum]SBS98174.1 hypothetical protein PMALA_062650 [Plasmodium malariae]SCO92911.1 Plasmodium exported protein, unknown function [Plasmodium malariae]
MFLFFNIFLFIVLDCTFQFSIKCSIFLKSWSYEYNYGNVLILRNNRLLTHTQEEFIELKYENLKKKKSESTEDLNKVQQALIRFVTNYILRNILKNGELKGNISHQLGDLNIILDAVKRYITVYLKEDTLKNEKLKESLLDFIGTPNEVQMALINDVTGYMIENKIINVVLKENMPDEIVNTEELKEGIVKNEEVYVKKDETENAENTVSTIGISTKIIWKILEFRKKNKIFRIVNDVIEGLIPFIILFYVFYLEKSGSIGTSHPIIYVILSYCFLIPIYCLMKKYIYKRIKNKVEMVTKKKMEND